MALVLHNGEVWQQPDNISVAKELHRKHVEAQGRRVQADRLQELHNILQSLQNNMRACANDHITIDGVKIIGVELNRGDVDTFNVFTNRAVGDLSDADRNAIEGSALITLLETRRAKCGSVLTYGLTCDCDAEDNEAREVKNDNQKKQ